MSYRITYKRLAHDDEEKAPVTQYAIVSKGQLKELKKLPWIHIYNVEHCHRKPCDTILG